MTTQEKIDSINKRSGNRAKKITSIEQVQMIITKHYGVDIIQDEIPYVDVMSMLNEIRNAA